MTLPEMEVKRDLLAAKYKSLNDKIQSATTEEEKRRFRIQALLVNDDLFSINDAIEVATQQLNEEAHRHRLVKKNSVDESEPIPGSLRDIARSYRTEMYRIQNRIRDVEDMPTLNEEEEAYKQKRLKILRGMLKDVSMCAYICEKYYTPGYHPDEDYVI